MHIRAPKYKIKPYLILVNIFLVVNILFATTGVALYKHYCFVDQKQDVSIYSYSDDCEHELVEVSCCSIAEEAEKEIHAKDDCCELDVDYLALTTPVTIKDETSFEVFNTINVFVVLDLFQNNYSNFSFNTFNVTKLPLPASGKNIVIAKQEFLA